MNTMNRILASMLATVGVIVAMTPQPSFAWGATGHREVSEAAILQPPAEVPAFVRSPDAVRVIGELGREADRSKGAGRTHDAERDPGHFIDVDDNGLVLGGPKMDNLPPTREEFDTALRAAGTTQYKAGYLYYSLIDGWLQLRLDFGYWRVLAAAEANATDPALKARYAADRALREMLTVRDLGVWSHLVADTSQPLHVSVHFNGWGNYPNPNNYSNNNTVHARFEGEFVHDNVSTKDILAKMSPVKDCGCPIETATLNYIQASVAQVVPLYVLEGKGAFVKGNAEGIAFTTGRLAAGANELRDLIVSAWRASAEASVGYPAVKVKDVEVGTAEPLIAMFGAD